MYKQSDFVGTRYVRIRSKWYDEYSMALLNDEGIISHMQSRLVSGSELNKHPIFDGVVQKEGELFSNDKNYVVFYEYDMFDDSEVYEMIVFHSEKDG